MSNSSKAQRRALRRAQRNQNLNNLLESIRELNFSFTFDDLDEVMLETLHLSFLSDVRLERDDMDNMFCAFRKSRAVIKDCFIQLNGSLRD
ncbi:MAG: hypothetical protein K1X68_01370 [Saprospiraceae bacterium]|nr:hypothetical protein [Saprospiraceae bacterium]HMX89147.1 hypothetical protein [Saprospiraceae bacterium]